MIINMFKFGMRPKTLCSQAKHFIHISTNAWDKMKTINSKTSHNTFLFAANSGGCGGLNYEFKNVNPSVIASMDTKSKIPLTFVENNGVKVYIDPISEMYLIGTTIDYIDEDYSKEIYESKFIFQPDKDIASTCGCGISFYIKE